MSWVLGEWVQGLPSFLLPPVWELPWWTTPSSLQLSGSSKKSKESSTGERGDRLPLVSVDEGKKAEDFVSM